MKNLNEILFVTEDIGENKWILSWKKPDFQVVNEEDSVEISKEVALKIIELLNK